jgi:hypothetical protein
MAGKLEGGADPVDGVGLRSAGGLQIRRGAGPQFAPDRGAENHAGLVVGVGCPPADDAFPGVGDILERQGGGAAGGSGFLLLDVGGEPQAIVGDLLVEDLETS